MEEMFLKIGEFGALGLVTVYLLTKGTAALKELAESNKALADSVKNLADKVITLDNRQILFEQQFRGIESRLDKIEDKFNELRHYIELNHQKNKLHKD